jgi:acyl carrier protein
MSTSLPGSTQDEAVTARLCEIVSSVAELDPEEVTPEASFYDDLFVDSLQKLEILVRIEREYGVKLTDVEATRLTCVADAAALIGARGASR